MSQEQQDVPLPLAGWRVERVYLDAAFGIMFIQGRDVFELRIGGPFTVKRGPTEVGYSAEDRGAQQLGGALGLLRKTARNAIALKDGTLEVAFTDGDSLSVRPDEHYEAWEMAGPRGYKIVSLPGGGLAVWSPADESIHSAQ